MKLLKILPLLIGMSFFMVACGSSGVSSVAGRGDGGVPEASLTADNASQSASAANQLINMTGLADLLGDAGGISSSSTSNKSGSSGKGILHKALDKVITIVKARTVRDAQLSAQGSSTSQTIACTNGGNFTLSATWSGPEPPAPASEIVDLKTILNFNSCNDGSFTMNGPAELAFNGPLSSTTGFTFSSSNITLLDSLGNNIRLTNFTLRFSSPRVMSSTTIMSGAISGSVGGSEINEEYDNTTIKSTFTQSGETFNIAGRMKPTCFDGWITISTGMDIFYPANADCPTAGEIIITSAGDRVSATIESNSMISVYFNDNLVETFTDCSELEGLCIG